MINSFDFKISNDEKLSQIKKRLLFFNKNKNDPTTLVDSQISYENLAFVACLIRTEIIHLDIIQVIVTQKVYENLAKLLQYLCSIKSEINFKNARKPLEYTNEFYDDTNLDERRIFIISNLNIIFNSLFLISNEVKLYFVNQTTDHGIYLGTLIDFINNTEFIKKFSEYDPFFDGFINLIWKLSYSDPEYKLIWKNFNSIEKLNKFVELFPKWEFEVYSTIAFIATNNELDNLKDLHKIIDKFDELIKICFNNSNHQTKKKYFNQGETFAFRMPAVLSKNGNYITIDDLLESLYQLTLNPNLRQLIYSKLIETIIKILTKSNEIVKYFALRVLCQLGFNDELKNQLKNDNKLIHLISNLKNESKFEFKDLETICNQVLWILNHSKNLTQPLNTYDNQITILAEAASNELILRLKSDLEAKNIKVFLNVHVNNLETIIGKIEQSSCVVICINEKFNQSIECQAVATYAFKLKKNIVPLILKSGYENVSGWIGIIIRNKTVHEFTEYIENFSTKLVDEIRNRQIQVTKKSETSKLQILSNQNNSIKNWTTHQVKEWLEKNAISADIIESLHRIDGPILFQLNEIKKYTPEFFYKSITKNSSNDCIEVAKFSDLLSKLFE